MGFTLQSLPFREMLGSSRSRVPSCRYPPPSAERGRSYLFPGRWDRTSRLQGFDPSRSPFSEARGLVGRLVGALLGLCLSRDFARTQGTLTLRERASLEVPALVCGANGYPCELPPVL